VSQFCEGERIIGAVDGGGWRGERGFKLACRDEGLPSKPQLLSDASTFFPKCFANAP
jgi:hypothetical protein